MSLLLFLKNIKKGISLILFVAVIALGALLKLEQLRSKELQKDLSIKELELDRTKAAQKSCEVSLRKLMEANKKKHTIIKEYEKKYHVGEDSEIQNLDDFINFANRINRLQH